MIRCPHCENVVNRPRAGVVFCEVCGQPFRVRVRYERLAAAVVVAGDTVYQLADEELGVRRLVAERIGVG